jgi:hypothetical protein
MAEALIDNDPSLFLSFPRKGTETVLASCFLSFPLFVFSYLFPARGRKPVNKDE